MLEQRPAAVAVARQRSEPARALPAPAEAVRPKLALAEASVAWVSQLRVAALRLQSLSESAAQESLPAQAMEPLWAC